MAYLFFVHDTSLQVEKWHIFTTAIAKMNERLQINKKSENVNKRKFFKKLFSLWKFNPKAIFYTTFKVFGWYLLQKLNFFRIHAILSPKGFPRPGAHQGQFFWPILWLMVSTIIGQKYLGVLLKLLRCYFSAVSSFHTASVKTIR